VWSTVGEAALSETGSHPRMSTVVSVLNVSSAIFTARCYASAVLAMGLCPSVSVSVSVCALSNGDIAVDLKCP